MYKTLKKIFKRSLWTMLTVFFTILFAIAIVGGNIASGFQAAINGFLGTDPYKQVQLGESDGPSTDYFKSEFTKKDAQGNTIYEKDDKDTWHPVYDDAAMRKNSEQKALQAAVEGSVLLWNNDNTLPLAEDSRVSMFGMSSANYVFLGDGSGAMGVSPPEQMRTLFPKYGLQLNAELYLKYYSLINTYKRGWRNPNEAPWSAIESTATSSVQANDTAVMIISRVAGESNDILEGTDSVDPNNYLDLHKNEKEVIQKLVEMRNAKKLKKVVLLINSDNAIQFKNIKTLGIDACVWVGQAGTMSYEQIAAVLSGRGDHVVSGHLPDTFAYNNYSAPANMNFGDHSWTESPFIDSNPNSYPFMTNNDKYIVYQEGVYVGYRYYETRYEDCVLGGGNAASAAGVKESTGNIWNYGSEVAYTFGHGLSYADLEYGDYKVERNANGVDYDVSVTVTNKSTSKHDGKGVLQVYLQKPYTDYDKAHGIEKPSVELVGFAKTKKLEPGQSTPVTVTVREEELRTYDADGERTYIFEEGDYYLAFGTDAHDALNNILAKKGKTTADGMDKDGDASFAHKITVDDSYNGYKSDKFKFSSHGKKVEITNRFDDADLNRYEGTKDDQSIVYLSRNDWQRTYPTAAVSLKCTDETMIEDMKYGHPVEVKEGDEMPVYETVTSPVGRLNLAMLMDKEYDDPLWQNLLDQMTVKEQQFLISYGLNHVAGADSVDAPGMESRDGPAGVKAGNPTLGSTFSFPSEPVLAATFNTPLIEEVGNAFGMEILHTGLTVIYGPGGCIHRSAYSGRNWEYFSEDGVLSGKMLAAETKGLQKYGVIVETKHYALNDTETNRYGIATFANEQSMRDVYLRAFEIAVAEGRMNGVMSSFNRVGCTWAGAHKGLLYDILRDEWGFDGIVESDSCTGSTGKYVRHMCSINAKAEGLLAGNDIWMCASGSEEFLVDHANDHEDFEQKPPSGKITADDMYSGKSYLDNATVMLALRESCHRILYAQLHSNAMNGMNAQTRVYKVKVWWQTAIEAMQITCGILMGLFALMAIASFIINTKWCKEKFRAAHAAKLEREASGAAPTGNIFVRLFEKFKALDLIKKILVIACAVVAVAAIVLAIVLPCVLIGGNNNVTPPPAKHVCQHVCPDCGLCLDADCQNAVCAEKCQGHPHECKSLCEICGKCYNILCQEEVCTVNGKCGHGKKVYDFEAENATLVDGTGKFGIQNANGGQVVGNVNQNMGGSITFDIDAAQSTTASLCVVVNRRSIDTVFTDTLLVMVNGKEFSSKTVIPATETGTAGWNDYITVNLGCIELDKDGNTIVFNVMSQGEYSGYNFDKIQLLCDVELSTYIPHTCEQKCDVCGKCLNLDCEEEVCTVNGKCQIKGATGYKTEAENAELKNGMSGNVTTKTEGERTVVTGLNRNNGAAISFTVYVRSDITVNPVITLSRRLNKVAVKDVFDITVGNSVYKTNAIVPAATGNVDMKEFAAVNLGCMNLKAGKNIVTFGVKTASDIGFDVDCIEFMSPAQVWLTAPDWYVEAVEYKFEAENAALTAGSKGLPGKNEREGVPVLWKLSGNIGAKVTFTVYSEFNKKANLYAAFAPCTSDTKITDIFDITVNGTLVASEALIKGGTTQLATSVLLGEIDLRDGTDNHSNVIEFTVKEGTSGFDIFDYIILETQGCEVSETYMAPTPEGHTHTYATAWSNDDEYHWHAGNCGHEFKKIDYAKHNFDSDNVCTDCGYTRTFVYEAEWAKFRQGSANNAGIQNGASGKVLGGLNNNGGTLVMFAVYSPSASTQKLYMSVNRKAIDNGDGTFSPLKISDGWQLFVNKTEFAFDDTTAVVPQPASGGVDWFTYNEVLLGEVPLVQGMNYFIFKVKSVSERACNVDYFKFQGDALVSAVNTYDGTANIYEGELAELGGGAYIGKDCTTSEGGLVSPELDGINTKLNASIKYTINSTVSGKVKLVIAVTIRDKDIKVNTVYDIFVNDTKITVDDSVIGPKGAKNEWFISAEIEVGEIDLISGTNTILFTTLGADSFNFDYIKLVPVE